MRGWAFALVVIGAGFGAGAFACSDDSSSGANGATTPDASADGSDTNEDGSTTNEDGSVVPNPTGPIDPTAAARAAIMLASCISDDGVNRTLQEFYLERTTNPF